MQQEVGVGGLDADKYKFIGNYSADAKGLSYNDIVIQHNYDTFIGLITTQAGPLNGLYIVAPVDWDCPMHGLGTWGGIYRSGTETDALQPCSQYL